MLLPNARARKERIFSMAVRPKIGKKGALDKYFNSAPPTIYVTQRHPSVYILPRGKLMFGVQGGMTSQALGGVN